MATLYFNNAVDAEWTELGNWWTNAGLTAQAVALPTSADSVIAVGNIDTNSGSEPTVVNFTMDDPGEEYVYNINSISITVTGNATFSGSSSHHFGTVTGNATFNDGATNLSTITGNATFNDSSFNTSGTVTGNATFNDGSSNYYYVTGDATFNDNSYNSGTVSGDATFNENAYNAFGTVTGNATFNDSSFTNSGTITGNATFSLVSAAVQIASGLGGSYGGVSFAYEKGINGSSILGVI